MDSQMNSASSSSAFPNGKRSRDLEDEVYLDNLHSHKRYLSEIMASSLNGLTVGDTLPPENLMESPARSESIFYYPRDEMSFQYSPMSDYSDDSRYCETLMNTCSSQAESLPTSPVSPYRYHRQVSGFSSAPPTTSYPSHSCNLPPVTSSQPRQRGSECEGRFPSSPSDICHSADLRRAALLRSVHMRTQPPGPSPFELPFSPGHTLEPEDRECSYLKSLVDDSEYHIDESPSLSISETDFNRENSCREVNMNLKEDDESAN